MNAKIPPKRYVLAVTGASGALYSRRLLEMLLATGAQVHLVVSEPGRRLLAEEMAGRDLLDGLPTERIVQHNAKDTGAPIASGSFLCDGMVVAPCTSHTLGAIASGLGDNLVHRAAQVMLKERRKLILLHREMPLSLIDIRNMETLTLAGAVVAPANPGFYTHPRTVDDLVDFVCARVMDLLGETAHGVKRWEP